MPNRPREEGLRGCIVKRLQDAVDAAGGLSPNQFGFKKATSTIDAIGAVVDKARKAIQGIRCRSGSKEYRLAVTLDLKNAFTSAKWECILHALLDQGIPDYLYRIESFYLCDRSVLFETINGPKTHKATCAAPQGSVFGPLLWNIMYDRVLNLDLPWRSKVISFADDVAIVVEAKTIREAEETSNAAIAVIQLWLSTASLCLSGAPEAVLFSSRNRVESAEISVGGIEIVSSRAIRYLSVMLDTLSYREYLQEASRKAAKVCRALRRIRLNTRGSSGRGAVGFFSVMRSTIMYAAPIWGEATSGKAYKRGIESSLRSCALRVISGFRTISDEAAPVIAGRN